MRQAYRERFVGSTVRFETWSEEDVVLVRTLHGREHAFSYSPFQCCGRWQVVLGYSGVLLSRPWV